jgi:hypothetical protein
MLPAPDFLRPARGRPALAWAFLAASASAFAVAASQAWDAWQSRSQMQAAVAMLERPVRPRPPAAPRAAQALAPLQAMLDGPWRARIEALDTVAPAGVAWLAIDLSHAGELQLVGLAQDAASALLAAERMRTAGPWTSAVVTRIEPVPGKLQRFELRAVPRESAR